MRLRLSRTAAILIAAPLPAVVFLLRTRLAQNALHAAFARLRIALRERLTRLPPPSFSIASVKHRRWLQVCHRLPNQRQHVLLPQSRCALPALSCPFWVNSHVPQPVLERYGWRSGKPATATFQWSLIKKVMPNPVGAAAYNCLPNLLLLDDKAVLGLLSRRFTRTQPLVTHVLFGDDDSSIDALQTRWQDPACTDPRWWIVKDAHQGTGFSAALLERTQRALEKKDVAAGHCYVVQEYVDRPMLVEGRKFELCQ